MIIDAGKAVKSAHPNRNGKYVAQANRLTKMQTAQKFVEKIRREVAATLVEHEASINYARSRYNDTNTTGIVPNVTIMLRCITPTF